MGADAGRTPAWHLPLLVILGLPVFFWGLGSYSVVNGDEGFYHSVAARMVSSGDWFHLDYFGQHRIYDTFMNAPLQYWARAVLISLFGDNLWTMRLLSAVFGLLSVLMVHRLGAALDPGDSKRGGSKTGALLGALVQLTCFQFVYLHGSRTGELDSIVVFLMAAAALTFLHAVRDGWSFAAHHVCLAVLLTVKLPATLMPVLAELVLFAATPVLRSHFKRYVLSGLAIVPLGLVWHAFQAAWLWEDFLGVAGKMGEEASGAQGGGDFSGGPLQNLAWYAHKLLFGFFPWSLAVVPALLAAAAVGFRRLRDGEGLALRIVLAFALVVWAFFALVSKRFPWYVLPSTPFLAVCTGWWLARTMRRARWTSVVALAAVVAFLVWLRVPIAGFRPLLDRAPRIPMEVAWREVDRLGVGTGIVLVFGLLAAGGLALLHSAPRRCGPIVGGVGFALLLSLAAVRVAVPLGSLEHVSDLEQVYRRVEADRAAGREVAYPIALPESMGMLRVRHYFGRDYLVERRESGRGARILVLGEKPKPTEVER